MKDAHTDHMLSLSGLKLTGAEVVAVRTLLEKTDGLAENAEDLGQYHELLWARSTVRRALLRG